MGLVQQKAARWGVSAKAAAVVLAAAAVLVAVLMLEGGFRVEYGESSFAVRATFWKDKTVDYADIESVTWCDHDDPGSRTNGYGSLTLLMGTFRNDEFGSYERYSAANGKVSVVIGTAEGTLVIGGKTEAETRAVYDELTARISEG